MITQGWNAGGNFAAGASAISLRGLTAGDADVVRRFAHGAPIRLRTTASANFVDMNTIRNDHRAYRCQKGRRFFVDRMPDAVVGVINVITKEGDQGKAAHANASRPASAAYDAGERWARADPDLGLWRPERAGLQLYVNGEYMKQDLARTATIRQFPLIGSRICNAGASPSPNTSNLNGINANGSVYR